MAKRFTKPTINWVEFEKRIPADQKGQFLAFKAKADMYLQRWLLQAFLNRQITMKLRLDQKCDLILKNQQETQRVQANPPEPPKINWEEYAKIVPVKGLVDTFKREYALMDIPYPEDTLSEQVDEQWEDLEPIIKTFCEEKQKDIDNAQKKLDKINALPKFEDMTMEMIYDMNPNEAFDPVNRPTFWPHTPDEQPGYKKPELKTLENKKE